MKNSTGLYFDDFEVGAKYITQARTVTESDVVTFAGLSGDFNPIHTDATLAQNTPFGERIAHGLLVVAMASGMANWTGLFAGTTIALVEQVIRYKGVVKFGDTVRLEMKIAEKKETSKPDRGILRKAIRILNQRDEVVIDGEWVVLMKRREGD